MCTYGLRVLGCRMFKSLAQVSNNQGPVHKCSFVQRLCQFRMCHETSNKALTQITNVEDCFHEVMVTKV